MALSPTDHHTSGGMATAMEQDPHSGSHLANPGGYPVHPSTSSTVIQRRELVGSHLESEFTTSAQHGYPPQPLAATAEGSGTGHYPQSPHPSFSGGSSGHSVDGSIDSVGMGSSTSGLLSMNSTVANPTLPSSPAFDILDGAGGEGHATPSGSFYSVGGNDQTPLTHRPSASSKGGAAPHFTAATTNPMHSVSGGGGIAKRGGTTTSDERRQRRLLRNRIAAKECRRKKKAYVQALEEQVEYLTDEMGRLRKELEETNAKLTLGAMRDDGTTVASPSASSNPIRHSLSSTHRHTHHQQ
ncbi:hypothetical protein H4R33_003842 [Dimargaris cristalligena]|nr:hypothetical protein H4R33_003842 [Dimargaris cristalligena]